MRARERLASMISHDLRNPLGVIQLQIAAARRLRDAGRDPQEAIRGAFERIERQVQRMDRLLSELLDLAQMQAGTGIVLEPKPLDLLRLVSDVVGQQTGQHRITLHSDLDSLLGEWDARRLERVVENLVGNALKYSPDPSPVRVDLSRVTEDGVDVAVLRVEDRGVGIPDADRARIFDWFARGQNVRASHPGTGIGLAGVRHIVEAHGGQVEVESQEGRGSTFTVRLPTRPRA
jgi:signal transduction histidine kinase